MELRYEEPAEAQRHLSVFFEVTGWHLDKLVFLGVEAAQRLDIFLGDYPGMCKAVPHRLEFRHAIPIERGFRDVDAGLCEGIRDVIQVEPASLRKKHSFIAAKSFSRVLRYAHLREDRYVQCATG